MTLAIDTCIPWPYTHNVGGYGVMRVDGKLLMAHRCAWELRYGPIADGMHIDHLCRNVDCINTDHMELVTPAENTRRMLAFRKPKTHCKRGHTLSHRVGRQHVCLTCRRITHAHRKAAA